MDKLIQKQMALYEQGIFYKNYEPTFIEDIKIGINKDFFNYLLYKKIDPINEFDTYENRQLAMLIRVYLAVEANNKCYTKCNLTDIIESTGYKVRPGQNDIVEGYKQTLVLLKDLDYILIQSQDMQDLTNEQILHLTPKKPILIWVNLDAIYSGDFYIPITVGEILPILTNKTKSSKCGLLSTYLTIKEQIEWKTYDMKRMNFLTKKNNVLDMPLDKIKYYFGHMSVKSIITKNNISNVTAQRYIKTLQSLGMIYKYNSSDKVHGNKHSASIYSLNEEIINQTDLINKYLEICY